MNRFIATFGYIGLMPFAPGTWGSLAAIILLIVLKFAGFGLSFFLPAIVVITLLGWWCIKLLSLGEDDPDKPEYVIDEVAGQWIAALPALVLWEGLGLQHHDIILVYVLLALSFIYFRFFDILKPWPISKIDGLKTPLSVMLDDVVAGLFALIVLCGCFYVLILAGPAFGL